MEIILPHFVYYIVFAIFACTVLAGCCFSVEQQTRRIVTRFGKFVKVSSPGLNFKLPLIESVSEPINLQTVQLELSELTYTDKGTSVNITANVQYRVDENNESVKLAHYKLAQPGGQIKSHLSSSIRGKVPTMTLESVQKNQLEIANHVKSDLMETMSRYGYIIEDVLITRADPDASVVKANNDKYASEQATVTAKNTAAANYTQVVEAAKATAEAMRINGEGIANEGIAIFNGLQTQVKQFEATIPGSTPKDAMLLVAFQQYVDMMNKVGHAGNSKVIFMNSGGGAVSELVEQIQKAIISGTDATAKS
jgi:regulator of protease activity HflC (stomatin/prohibitin superfamily)